MEEFYGTRYQSGSFSQFLNVGGGFYRLRSFPFRQYVLRAIKKQV